MSAQQLHVHVPPPEKSSTLTGKISTASDLLGVLVTVAGIGCFIAGAGVVGGILVAIGGVAATVSDYMKSSHKSGDALKAVRDAKHYVEAQIEIEKAKEPQNAKKLGALAKALKDIEGLEEKADSAKPGGWRIAGSLLVTLIGIGAAITAGLPEELVGKPLVLAFGIGAASAGPILHVVRIGLNSTLAHIREKAYEVTDETVRELMGEVEEDHHKIHKLEASLKEARTQFGAEHEEVIRLTTEFSAFQKAAVMRERQLTNHMTAYSELVERIELERGEALKTIIMRGEEQINKAKAGVKGWEDKARAVVEREFTGANLEETRRHAEESRRLEAALLEKGASVKRFTSVVEHYEKQATLMKQALATGNLDLLNSLDSAEALKRVVTETQGKFKGDLGAQQQEIDRILRTESASSRVNLSTAQSGLEAIKVEIAKEDRLTQETTRMIQERQQKGTIAIEDELRTKQTACEREIGEIRREVEVSCTQAELEILRGLPKGLKAVDERARQEEALVASPPVLEIRTPALLSSFEHTRHVSDEQHTKQKEDNKPPVHSSHITLSSSSEHSS